MTQFSLPSHERRLLESLVAQTTDATVLRRGQALLWVASGDCKKRASMRIISG